MFLMLLSYTYLTPLLVLASPLVPIPLLEPVPLWNRFRIQLFWSTSNLDSDSSKNWNHTTLTIFASMYNAHSWNLDVPWKVTAASSSSCHSTTLFLEFALPSPLDLSFLLTFWVVLGISQRKAITAPQDGKELDNRLSAAGRGSSRAEVCVMWVRN